MTCHFVYLKKKINSHYKIDEFWFILMLNFFFFFNYPNMSLLLKIKFKIFIKTKNNLFNIRDPILWHSRSHQQGIAFTCCANKWYMWWLLSSNYWLKSTPICHCCWHYRNSVQSFCILWKWLDESPIFFNHPLLWLFWFSIEMQ
jgi:hypothetical protein